MSRLVAGILVISCLGGCTAETGSAELADDSVAEVSQAVTTTTWNPHSEIAETVAIADISPPAPASTRTYQWFENGTLCYGFRSDACWNRTTYHVPGDDYLAIRGIGIAKNTSRVYAWYADSTVSVGNSEYFEHYNSKTPFTRPLRPGSTTATFTMDELIEVDNSDNGAWYYYWRDGDAPHANIFRTTGSSVNGGGRLGVGTGATRVNSPFPNWASIAGIAFGSPTNASLMVFYKPVNATDTTAKLVISTNSLTLQ